ncbi:MAG TPA: hypothetical protein VFF32_04850 [Dermatophilaceae bacterium]|nr:hypothetical protein [Dermatophilaceae bacterium]
MNRSIESTLDPQRLATETYGVELSVGDVATDRPRRDGEHVCGVCGVCERMSRRVMVAAMVTSWIRRPRWPPSSPKAAG